MHPYTMLHTIPFKNKPFKSNTKLIKENCKQNHLNKLKIAAPSDPPPVGEVNPLPPTSIVLLPDSIVLPALPGLRVGCCGVVHCSVV